MNWKTIFIHCLTLPVLFVQAYRASPLDDPRFDPTTELVLTDADEIRDFFERVSTLDLTKWKKRQRNQPNHTRSKPFENGRAFLPSAVTVTADTGLLGGSGTTTNLINAASSILAAAATGQQPGATITAMTPAQQIMNTIRNCPALTSAVCAPAGQCLLAGGVSIGNCAIMGLLVCCTLRQEIPQTCVAANNLVSIRERISTISSNAEGHSCQYEVYKSDTGICQLQLEFETFELEAPLWGEDCSPNSIMTISDSVTVRNGFPLCGLQNGTRLYLSYGRSSRISLNFITTATDSYRVRIKQVDCKDQERVPDQCLQNHESLSGTIKSFGFPQYMINNQKYTICVNSKGLSDNIGYITWNECSIHESRSDSYNNFMMSEYFIANIPVLDDTGESTNGTAAYFNYYNYYNSADAHALYIPSEGTTCLSTSYIEIHGEDRHCGAKFRTTTKQIRSESRPYMLTVNIVPDTATNVPEFALYRIKGLPRTSNTGLTDPLPPNDCEETWSEAEESTQPGSPQTTIIRPSTQGFEPCEIVTKNKIENVDHDLCFCVKKDGSDLPNKPKPRPDLLQRKGFCLRYSVFQG